MQVGSRVRVMVDLDGRCLRGRTQVYEGKKLYVGTGISQVSREDLFCTPPADLRYAAPDLTYVCLGQTCFILVSDVLAQVWNVFAQT